MNTSMIPAEGSLIPVEAAAPWPNSAFSSSVRGFQVYWDSTSLGNLKACPRKYYYTMVAQSGPRKGSAHLAFGSYYHSALEHYDHLRARGQSHEAAQIGAVRAALTLSWGWESDIPEKTRKTLIRTVAWYLEQFADDPAHTVILANGEPAVELSFRFQLLTDPEPIFLCGHLDRLAEFGGRTYVLDRKTTKMGLYPSFFDQFTPHNQFSLYTIAASIVYGKETSGVIVDAAQIGVGFSRFARAPIPRAADQDQEWLRDLPYYLRSARQFAIDGYWPMNEASCSMYGGCPFRVLCSKPPSSRQVWETSLLQPHEWNPTVPRGNN